MAHVFDRCRRRLFLFRPSRIYVFWILSTGNFAARGVELYVVFFPRCDNFFQFGSIFVEVPTEPKTMFAIRITTMLLLLRCSVAFIPTVLKGLGTSRSESVVAHAMQNEWKKKGPMESAGGPGNVMAAATVPVQFKVKRFFLILFFIGNPIKKQSLCTPLHF